MRRLLALAAIVALVGGCAQDGITGTKSTDFTSSDLEAFSATGPGLTVMTWNVYYGTDPEPLLTAPLDQVPILAAEAWALAQRTNFPERAGRLAARIAEQRPHLVGLQEAALYRVQHPGDAAFGGSVPATDVVYDFLALLTDSLEARGLHYIVVAADSTTDVELPAFTGVDPATGIPTFDDVRLTDRDAVLARSDVQIDDDRHGVFGAYIPLPEFQSGVYEGWSSVRATVDGRSYRFVSAHLEFQGAIPVQVLQAQELVALLGSETLPTILVGDFNSDVASLDPSKATPSYGIVTGAGFTDNWLVPSATPASLTCCQSKDLLNPRPAFTQRIDFVFTRNMPAGTQVLQQRIVGDKPHDRTASGLWPSDHAGVAVRFLIPPPEGPSGVVAE
jgi:hypothetical protein